jgi:hypothetical protein
MSIKKLTTRTIDILAYSLVAFLMIEAIYSFGQALIAEINVFYSYAHMTQYLSSRDQFLIGVISLILAIIIFAERSNSEKLKRATATFILTTGFLLSSMFLTVGTIISIRKYEISSEKVAAWIQADASIFALAVAIGISYFQSRKQIQQETERRENDNRSVLESIRIELEIFKGGLLTEVKDWCDDASSEHSKFSIPADPFSIYKGSIGYVGKISQSWLKTGIITTYAKCFHFVAMVDTANSSGDHAIQKLDQKVGRIHTIQKLDLHNSAISLFKEVEKLIKDINGWLEVY